MKIEPISVFIIGGTGFMGQALTEELLHRGHAVTVLARPGSEKNAAIGATVVTGDPRDRSSYVKHLVPQQTLVQLAGVAHPNPLKKNLFRMIDFVCGRESVLAAREAKARQLIYVSVAQPAPIMRAYIEARADVEKLIGESGVSATILRPWYVIGPGRRWPLLLLPLYWIFESQSATRDFARRLAFVTLREMVQAMANAIENPAPGVRVWDVPEIKRRT